MKRGIVVDTNVAVVANGSNEQADDACVERCVRVLKYIIDGRVCLLLDDGDQILEEYRKNLIPTDRDRQVGNMFVADT